MSELIGLVVVALVLWGMAKAGMWMISGPSMIDKSKPEEAFRESPDLSRYAKPDNPAERRSSNCVACGSALKPQAAFCGQCGNKIAKY